MDNMKNIKKMWDNSLSFLDNSVINSIIVVILVLYSSTIFDNINSFIGNIYNFSIVKLVVLLLIIYVAPKDTTIAILLAVSYLVSLNYMVPNETFVTGEEHKQVLMPPYYPSSNNTPSQEEQKKMTVTESFFPIVNTDESSFDLRLKNVNMDTRNFEPTERVTNLKPDSCMQNYSPEYEAVGDVCAPTATFKNELNAQGLNFPEGFNSPVSGSPLN